MKKYKFFLLLLCLCVPILFVSCENNNNQKINPTVSVALVNSTKTYFENEKITVSDLKLETNEISGIISLESDYITLNVGLNDIKWIFTPTDTEKFNNVSGIIQITALEEQPSSIFVKTKPSKLDGYYAYDEFDDSGMELYFRYPSGSSKKIDSGWTISYQKNQSYFCAGDTKVIISYQTFTTELQLNNNFKVKKFRVDIPEIDTKVYCGENIYPTVEGNTENEYYSFDNTSYTNAGAYSVNLTLKDYSNCEWTNCLGKTISLNFEIQKASRAVKIEQCYSLFTGSNIEISTSFVKTSFLSVESAVNSESLEITYYVDENGTIKTTSLNSGSLIDGGAPKNVGTYFVQVKYFGDNNFNDCVSELFQFNIIDNNKNILNTDFGWKYLTGAESVYDLPFITFEEKMFDNMKMIYMNLVSDSNIVLTIKSGIVFFDDEDKCFIYDTMKNKVEFTQNSNYLIFENSENYTFQKWTEPSYVGDYECNELEPNSWKSGTLQIYSSNGSIKFTLSYTYRNDITKQIASGTNTVNGYIGETIKDNENYLYFYTINADLTKNLIPQAKMSSLPTKLVLENLGLNILENYEFIKKNTLS